jgi:hypothetical protein
MVWQRSVALEFRSMKRRRYRGRFACIDCGVDTRSATGIDEYYAVHDDVWAATGLAPRDGMLCIGCLERRIGRRLEPKDFDMKAPINHSGGGSERLQSRKRHREQVEELRRLVDPV